MRGEIEKIVGFLIRADRRGRGVGMILIRGADKGELALIGDGEDDPAVAPLQEIAPVMIEQPAGDDMASSYQTNPIGRIGADDAFENTANPGTAGIHQHPCTNLPFP